MKKFPKVIAVILSVCMFFSMIVYGGGSTVMAATVESSNNKVQKQKTVEARVKEIIKVEGLYFKDLNANKQLDPYEDWRLNAKERATNLVSLMTADEKIGLLVINSRNMGMYQKDKSLTSHNGLIDESVNMAEKSVLGVTSRYGTTTTIEKLHLRHFILRSNPKPGDMAEWINAMNEIAEGTRLGIPVIVASNSRNENTESAFDFNESSGVFSTWPGTLGLAAAAKGDIKAGKDASLISEFSKIARSEWDACGLKKGYMYMADVITDPRWQRSYGTMGEDPKFISDAIGRIIEGFQGKELSEASIGLTIKHFPGGGSRENGFDPHYEEGKWNVYSTPGSLEKYHLPPFQAAVKKGCSSIMPYYSMPSKEKSAQQQFEGRNLDFTPQGFAYNKIFIQDVLRGMLGFTGYINSDSGILTSMAWGVSNNDVPTRAAMAINNGVDIISDTNDIWSIKEAYLRGLLTDNAINRAAERTLKEMFELGLFENPYRDPDNANKIVSNKINWDEAYNAHQKSVVLLKNHDNVLPLTAEKLKGKKVYVEVFEKEQKDADTHTKVLRENIKKITEFDLTENYEEADYAVLFVRPTSGSYFDATKGYLELDITENKPEKALDGSDYTETTLAGAKKIKTISEAVHTRGGKVITNVNFVLAWLLNNVEPHSDAVLAGFDTLQQATIDVITGKYNPTGVLPLTLPKSPEVIAVDANGKCVSPNDVPGYDKDKYMPKGMSYAYVDSDGNTYRLDFGLTYK